MATEDSAATIRRILSAYDLGGKLKRLRLRKKIGLVDLGKHTGLSPSMLSQLENGKLVPTLPTLARIAMVFDVSLDHFFGSRREKALISIVRSDERIRFPDRPGNPEPSFVFECLAYATQDKGMQAYLAEFPKRTGETAEKHFHEGAEFIHVLEGSMVLLFEDEEYLLKTGDSAYFDSSGAHGYRGRSKKASRALVVTTPPRL